MKIVSVDQMQRIESASDGAGHSYSAMMELAGRSVAQAIGAMTSVGDSRVVVLVGPGNNGGDGLVAGRYLSEAGAQVTCYLYKARNPGDDENFRLVLEGDAKAAFAEDDEGFDALQDLVDEADILIDALLGTGTRLPLRGELAEMLSVVRAMVDDRRRPPTASLQHLTAGSKADDRDQLLVVGVDGPTGLDYDSGGLDERAIAVDLTVTFAYPKVGHFRLPGGGALGDLVVADIGIDPALAEDVTLEVVTPRMVRGWLPRREPGAHKGTFGKAMIVAGSVNYTGAAYLVGASATRAGAGLVTLGLPGVIHGAVAAGLVEATYLLLPDAMGVIARDAAKVLREELDGYDALLIGPGLGREDETTAFFERLVGGGKERQSMGFLGVDVRGSHPQDLPPLVVDADGLNILSEMKGGPGLLPRQSILTPHPGEMARLTGGSVAEVQENRVGVARSWASEWGQVVVLKGAYTVVAGPDGQTVIEPFANAGLATAGTGDVLAGTIVALRAQGLGAFEAAAAGAYVHGLAGELARGTIGVAGMVAGDVLRHLPEALERVAAA